MNNAINVARDTRNSLLGSTGVWSSSSSGPSDGGFQDWSLSFLVGGEKSSFIIVSEIFHIAVTLCILKYAFAWDGIRCIDY